MKTLELFQTAPHLSPKASTRLIAQALQEDPITTIAIIFFLSDQQGQHQLVTQLNSIVVDHLSSYDEFFDAYLRLLSHVPDISSWATFYSLYGTHPYVDMHILSTVETAIVDMQLPDAINWFPIYGPLTDAFALFISEDIDALRVFILDHGTHSQPDIPPVTDYSSSTSDTMQTCISPYLHHVSAAF